jgi:hypothetical protein
MNRSRVDFQHAEGMAEMARLVVPVALRLGLPAKWAYKGLAYSLVLKRFRRLTLRSATVIAAAQLLPPALTYA